MNTNNDSPARHDPHVSHGTALQYGERSLIGWAIVRCDRTLDGLEFDDDNALPLTGFIDLHRRSSCQESTAARFDRRAGERCVGCEFGGIRDLAVAGNPIGVAHIVPS